MRTHRESPSAPSPARHPHGPRSPFAAQELDLEAPCKRASRSRRRPPSWRASDSSRAASLALLALLAPASCGDGAPARTGPNVLFVVWDTVRADRMSLYGYARPTTPRLDDWARDALVFDDCRSTAGITVSSHAAMFTGLLPTESGADNAHQWLDEGHATLAEHFRDAGWRTFAWSANPHISAEENFTQGFETVRHPWDPATRARALAIVRAKVEGDRSSELATRVERDDAAAWSIKAAGELAAPALAKWLERNDDGRPWFAFVNWMEAHRPLVPPRELRARMLSPAEVERSYAIDLSWPELWAFTFGLEELSPEDLAIVGGVYDAALLELDGLFADLLATLDAAGQLENTIIVLTSDHGEHLGEHHMLDHQYSLHEDLLDVPLVLKGTSIAPGREARPVTNHDLFPTLLDLCGIKSALPPSSDARSLFDPAATRLRLAEYPAPFEKPFELLEERYPSFDPAPWSRSLRSLRDADLALLARDDATSELYRALRGSREPVADESNRARLTAELTTWVAELHARTRDAVPAATKDHNSLLEDLGYTGTKESTRDEDGSE